MTDENKDVTVTNRNVFKIGICIALIALIAIIVAVVLNNKPYNPENEYVAAEMGDFKIYEADVTNYMKEFKTEYGLDTEEKWNDFLALGENTNASARMAVINAMIERHIGEEFTQENGIQITDEEIAREYNERYRVSYIYDGGYDTILRNSFLTDDMNRALIKNDLACQKYVDSLEDEEVTEEAVMNEINEHLDTYNTLAYRDFIILNDKYVLNIVMEKLAAGEDFESLKEKYCLVETPDTGWSGAITARDKDSEEFYNQLVNLKKGEYTQPYQESEHEFIIGYCKERFTDLDISSYENIPSDIVDMVKRDISDGAKADKVAEYKNDIAFNRGNDIIINEPLAGENLQY